MGIEKHRIELTRHLSETYLKESAFVSAYTMNPARVFRTAVRHLKVIPYDLKEILKDTYDAAVRNNTK